MKKGSFFPHLLVVTLLFNSATCFSDTSVPAMEGKTKPNLKPDISAPNMEDKAKEDFKIASERFKGFCDACKNGEKKKVISFLNQYVYSEGKNKIKFDINGKDKDGNSPLSLALKAGHKEIVDLLKDAGAV